MAPSRRVTPTTSRLIANERGETFWAGSVGVSTVAGGNGVEARCQGVGSFIADDSRRDS